MWDNFTYSSLYPKAPTFDLAGRKGQLTNNRRLITDLAAEGFDVPYADRFDEIVDLTLTGCESEPIADPLALGADELRAAAIDRATKIAARDFLRDVADEVRAAAFETWQSWIRDNMDAIVSGLGAKFDRAAENARTLVKAGVRPTATAAEVIELDPAVIKAWNAYRSGDVAELTRLAELRISVAVWSLTAPAAPGSRPSGRQGLVLSACILGGSVDTARASVRDAEDAHTFFLRNALRLKIATPAEVQAGIAEYERARDLDRRAAEKVRQETERKELRTYPVPLG